MAHDADAASKEDEEDTLERLEIVRFETEVVLSDWGLARFPQLAEQLRTDGMGHIPLNDLIDCPSLRKLRATIADVVRIFAQNAESATLELIGDHSAIKRKTPLNEAILGQPLEQWISQTLYVENIPGPGRRNRATPAKVRDQLSELFDTPVQTVRFPPVFDKDAPRRDRSGAGDATLYETHPGFAKLDKAARKALRIPEDGGPFKGFAFIVLADLEATQRILREWAFGRGQTEENLDGQLDALGESCPNGEHCQTSDEDDSDSDKSEMDVVASQDVRERAKRNGLQVMQIAEWNGLRASYLSYKRALEKLHDEYEDNDWRHRDRQRDRDRYERNSRSRDESFWSHPRRTEDEREEEDLPPRPSDAERWSKRSPTPDSDLLERIPGSLVQVLNVSRDGQPMAVKMALNALLARDCPQVGTVAHVDQAYSSIRAVVRCSSAAAAKALVDLFAGDPRTHSEARGEDEDAFELMGPMDEAPTVKATLLTAAEEKAYWAEFSRHAANGGDRRRNVRGDRARAKHMRFA